MSLDRLIVEAIKVAQDLLRQNLPPMPNLTDAATVLRLRELVHSPAAYHGCEEAARWRAEPRAAPQLGAAVLSTHKGRPGA
jgi:hypothetical protein